MTDRPFFPDTGSGSAQGGSSPAPLARWTLNLTTHLGYAAPDRRPQFSASLGHHDLVAHVRHAASLGMTGVLHPWAAESSPSEFERVSGAMRETGLEASTVVTAPIEALRSGIWGRRGAVDRRELAQHVSRAARTAELLGSRSVAALLVLDGVAEATRQREAMIHNLRAMSSLAADRGAKIGVEPMTRLPGSYLTSVADAVSFLDEVDDTNVGLIFDTGHVAAMGEDIVSALEASFHHVQLIQLADGPGRVEPGAGDLPLVELVVRARELGYDGLIDLEHGWLEPGPRGESRGLERLRAFDLQVREGSR